MAKPGVSIIICTRDRAENLRLTLESLRLLTAPPSWEVELIIVDNGSTDATAALIAGFELPVIKVRPVREPRLGKGYAYNTGIAEASGEALLFTDDDVRVPRNWIEGMCRPIIDGETDGVAGRVIFPKEIDEALRSSPMHGRRNWLASTDGLDLRRPSRMVGANMAFHRRVPESGLLFDVALGPGGLGFGDETLFSWMLLEAGFTLNGAPDVVVEHHFDVSRLSKEAVRAIASRMGRSEGYLAWHWKQQDVVAGAFRITYWTAQHAIGKLMDRLAGGSAAAIETRELWYLNKLGFHEQFWKESRKLRKYARQPRQNAR